MPGCVSEMNLQSASETTGKTLELVPKFSYKLFVKKYGGR